LLTPVIEKMIFSSAMVDDLLMPVRQFVSSRAFVSQRKYGKKSLADEMPEGHQISLWSSKRRYLTIRYPIMRGADRECRTSPGHGVTV
jgi:hypothetical protein